MVSPDEGDEVDPLIQPRAIRALKNRPRLISLGFREEVLEQMEETVKQRRHPDTVAEKAAQGLKERAEDATEPVVRGRLRNRVRQANERLLKNL